MIHVHTRTFNGNRVVTVSVINGAELPRDELIKSIVDTCKDGEFEPYGIKADKPTTVRLNASETFALLIQSKD